MCEYFEISRSGYSAWRKRKNRPDRDEKLGRLIRECQEQTKYTYGYRRVALWLLRETGLLISHKAVLRLMRKYNLLAHIRRPRAHRQRQQQLQAYENKLMRNFHADYPVQPPGLVPRSSRGKLIVWFLNRRQELPPVQAACSPKYSSISR